jgi:hypothetical protein
MAVHAYHAFRYDLRSDLDKATRQNIIFLLPARGEEQDEILKSSTEMVRYLERKDYISETNVDPFLKTLRLANNTSLNRVIKIVETYQVKALEVAKTNPKEDAVAKPEVADKDKPKEQGTKCLFSVNGVSKRLDHAPNCHHIE